MARSQTPSLDVCFDEHETGLPKVDVNTAGSIGANSWEQIPVGQASIRIFHLAPVLRKEDRSRARPIANTENVTLLQSGSARSRGEREVVGFIAVGVIRDRVPTESRKAERRVRLCGKPDCDIRCWGQVEHLGLPVVHFVQLG